MTYNNLKYRQDIDGLRGIAILSVVLFHVFPDYIGGGFIGVDIFFVISGFLISSIIFLNLENKTFSFIEFYKRRIKRIFPTLILILIVCLCFGWISLFSEEYRQLGKHIAAGSFFISNFIYWNESGYFDNLAETKPLLHLWSLAVEEQFYIIWPLLLYIAYKFKFNLFIVSLLFFIGSFFFNIIGLNSDVVASFYLPHTRFWELLSGSILSYFTIYYKNLYLSISTQVNLILSRIINLNNVDVLSNILSIFGFGLLLYGFYKIDKNLVFPGFWAFIPVLGTIMIILANQKAWLNQKILTNKIIVWFGLISYPLYLWHWPLLSFVHIIESNSISIETSIILILLSIFLAFLTYKLLEYPIRYSHSKKIFILLIVIIICIGFLGISIYKNEGFKFRNIEKNTQLNTEMFVKPVYQENKDFCEKTFNHFDNGHCIINEKIHNLNFDIIFMGDSHSEALSLGYKNMNEGKNFLAKGKGGTAPFVNVSSFYINEERTFDNYFKPILDLILDNTQLNSTLIITARFSYYMEGSGFGEIEKNFPIDQIHIQETGSIKLERSLSLYKDIFSNGLLNTLNLISDKVKNIIIVLQVPELGFEPKGCIERPFQITKSDCFINKEEVLNRQNNYRLIINEIAKNFRNVKVYDPLDVFCDQEKCYAVRNEEMLYRDDDHISILGAKAIVNDMYKKGFLEK